MPQMAPMNWLTLFIMFTTIFIMFNSLNYFSLMKQKEIMKTQMKTKTMLNWKW